MGVQPGRSLAVMRPVSEMQRSADCLGPVMRLPIAVLRWGLGVIFDNGQVLATLVNRQSHATNCDGTDQIHQPFHAPKVGQPPRFFKCGALPC